MRTSAQITEEIGRLLDDNLCRTSRERNLFIRDIYVQLKFKLPGYITEQTFRNQLTVSRLSYDVGIAVNEWLTANSNSQKGTNQTKPND